MSHVAVSCLYQVEGGHTPSVSCVSHVVEGCHTMSVSCVSHVAMYYFYRVEGGQATSVSCVSHGLYHVCIGRDLSGSQTPSVSCESHGLFHVCISERWVGHHLYHVSHMACIMFVSGRDESHGLYHVCIAERDDRVRHHLYHVCHMWQLFQVEDTYIKLKHTWILFIRLYPQGGRTCVAMNCAHHRVYRWRLEDNMWIYDTYGTYVVLECLYFTMEKSSLISCMC